MMVPSLEALKLTSLLKKKWRLQNTCLYGLHLQKFTQPTLHIKTVFFKVPIHLKVIT